jgi:hypothetical protein
LAASRKPGALGIDGLVIDLNSRAHVPHHHSIPGSTGGSSHQSLTHRSAHAHRAHVTPKKLAVLRQGDRGADVRWAQALLNYQSASAPHLRLDGVFGPKTHEAVLSFQRSAGLKVDGIVGRHTWTALVQTNRAAASTIATPAASIKPRPVAGTQQQSVRDWPLTRRFEVVLKTVPKHLPKEMAEQFRAMLTPLNIGIAGSGLAAWAVSHAFGVGEIVDVILGVVGFLFIGLAIFKAGEDIGSCLAITLNATEPGDLDRAADYLAQAVVILGVTAFFLLLARVATRFAGSRAASEGGSGSSSNPPPDSPPPADDGPPPADEPDPPPDVPPSDPKALAAALRDAPPGSPERAALADQFAKISTHSAEPANRVVLGQYEEGAGYVAEAENHGGVYYKTPDGTYQIMGKQAAWETNEAFLKQQMATGKPIEFTGMSEDEVASKLADLQAAGKPIESASARYREFVFMQQNAASYGYVQQGMTFVKP